MQKNPMHSTDTAAKIKTAAPIPENGSLAIIGAGITGLSSAYYLLQQRPDVKITIFEASRQAGGILQTEQRDGFLVERGPDMFTTREPEAIDLCQELNIEDQLISTNTEHRGAYIFSRDQLCKIPVGWTMLTPTRLGSILTTRLLSWKGKLRVIAELFIRCQRTQQDESLASFTRRRLGQEAFERIIQPLISGIYTADPEKLSMQATLKPFLNMEREGKGLIRGGYKQRRLSGDPTSSGARYGMFVAPEQGMQSLVQALTAALPTDCLRLGCRVHEVSSRTEGWSVNLEDQQQPGHFDAVLISTSSQITSHLLAKESPELSNLVGQIPLAGAAVVTLGYRRCDIDHPLDAFGVIVPQIENRPLIAISISSQKFAGRAPEDCVLFRVFSGGACQEEVMQWDDQQIIASTKQQLQELLQVKGEPLFSQLKRWDATMPQYHVGHVDLVDQIEQQVAAIPGLELAGNAYRGIGIPLCIRSAKSAVQRLIA